MTLADTLRSYRTHLKLSQSDLAARWGMSVRTLQGWESGREPPPTVVVLVRRLVEVGG